MIAIIDYKAGNLASVSNALKRLNAEFIITDDIRELNQASAVIFPGVGHAKAAMNALSEKNLDSWLKSATVPVLGICLGMQLLFESTSEGDSECLGIIPGKLQLFPETVGKVPHMGWNSLTEITDHPLLKGISEEDFVYFVHSYFAPKVNESIALCNYGFPFSAAVAKDNFAGVQFHPEKSGKSGEIIIRNFLNYASGQF